MLSGDAGRYNRLGLRGSSEELPISLHGYYVFEKQFYDLLNAARTVRISAREILPASARDTSSAYLFKDYWEDMGHRSVLQRQSRTHVSPDPPFSFYDERPHLHAVTLSASTKLLDSKALSDGWRGLYS